MSVRSAHMLMKCIPSFKKVCNFGLFSSWCRGTPEISVIFCFSRSSRRSSHIVPKIEKFGLSSIRCKNDATKRCLILNFCEHNKTVVTNSYFRVFRIIVRVQTVMTELYCDFPQCLQAISVVQFEQYQAGLFSGTVTDFQVGWTKLKFLEEQEYYKPFLGWRPG